MAFAIGAAKYKLLDPGIGYPDPYTSKDVTQRLELGRICYGKDSSGGAGTGPAIAGNPYDICELMYVSFTGAVNAGDFVIVDRINKTAAQVPAVAATAKSFSVGVSMAAQIAGAFGWIMIRGVHDAANVINGTAVGSVLSGSAVAGQASTGVANFSFSAARLAQAPVNNQGIVELYWPYVDGLTR